MFRIFLLALGFFISSCNMYGDSDYTYGRAKLGNLANADVYVFKIGDDGSLFLHNTDKTSDKATLEETGLFLIKTSGLSDNDLLLIEVRKGLDWDADDNGVKDEVPTKNNGVIRAFLTGKELKFLKDKITVSFLSELVYELVAKDFIYNFDKKDFIQKINDTAKLLLNSDINGDGVIDNRDVLIFDPVKDKYFLKDDVKGNLKKVLSAIHKGKYPPVFYVSSIPLSKTAVNFTKDIKYKDGYLFVGTPYGVSIYDYTFPYNPKTVSFLSFKDWVWGIDLKGNFLAVANQTDGFKIIDVSDKENPYITSVFYPDDYKDIEDTYDATSVSFDSKNLLITANGIHGFSIYNLENPSSPYKILSYKPCDSVVDAYLKDNYAFVLCNNDGLKVYNVENLEKVFSFAKREELTDLEVYDDKLAFSTLYGNVYLFDIKNPENIKFLSKLTFREEAIFSLKIHENKLYIPLFYSGLSVYDISDLKNLKHLFDIKLENQKVYSVEVSGKKIFIGTRNWIYLYDLGVFEGL